MGNIRTTSLLAYHQIIDEGLVGERQQLVMDAIHDMGSATDREIAERLVFQDPNAVRPRRKELLDMGIIESKEIRVCSISHRRVHAWGIKAEIHFTPLERKIICPMCHGKKYITQPQTSLTAWGETHA